MRSTVTFTAVRAGMFVAPSLAVLYNLPLLLAFDVLRQVLNQLKKEKQFTCSSDHLGPLMDDAKTALPWFDWQAVRDGVHRRNAVAHDGALLDGKVCIADIERIESQLVAWQVIDPP